MRHEGADLNADGDREIEFSAARTGKNSAHPWNSGSLFRQLSLLIQASINILSISHFVLASCCLGTSAPTGFESAKISTRAVCAVQFDIPSFASPAVLSKLSGTSATAFSRNVL